MAKNYYNMVSDLGQPIEIHENCSCDEYLIVTVPKLVKDTLVNSIDGENRRIDILVMPSNRAETQTTSQVVPGKGDQAANAKSRLLLFVAAHGAVTLFDPPTNGAFTMVIRADLRSHFRIHPSKYDRKSGEARGSSDP